MNKKITLIIIFFIITCYYPIIKSEEIEFAEIGNRNIIITNSPPIPPEDTSDTVVTRENLAHDSVILSEVPTAIWTYGCTGTTAGMLFGYYDRIGYPNIYAGSANNGVCPLTNLGQGCPDVEIGYPIQGSCYIIATEQGLDGITYKGHADDYWDYINNPGPDPCEGNWDEHKWGLCLSDYMGISQWKWDYNLDGTIDNNIDGGGINFYRSNGQKDYDYIPKKTYGLPQTSISYGMRLFAESRGYEVKECFTQQTNTRYGHEDGFTFNEFKAEIDAGRPVFTEWVLSSGGGHAMLGVGYNTESNSIFIHDTWDNDLHEVGWNQSYVGYNLICVTIIKLENVELDQNQEVYNDYNLYVNNDYWVAQSFTPNFLILTSVEILLYRPENVDYNLTISIYDSLSISSQPITTLTKTPEINEKGGSTWIVFNFPDVILYEGVKYYIVCKSNEKTINDYKSYGLCLSEDEDSYQPGEIYISTNQGVDWKTSEENGISGDCCFRTYGIDNNPPDKPICKYNNLRDEISVYSIDVDENQIRYGISWNDDNEIDEWTEFHDSGFEVLIEVEGNNNPIGIIAEDEYGFRSIWASIESKPKENKYFWEYNTLLLRLIQIFQIIQFNIVD